MSFIYSNVKVIRVIDGDTVFLEIDAGNKMYWRSSFRLNLINTPERGKPGFAEATDRLTELLSHGISKAETHKPDKWGRWLVDIYRSVNGGEQLVNQMMVSEGFATIYVGGVK